jgi:pimeloyl-ACP methyl ester carboxylesterase
VLVAARRGVLACVLTPLLLAACTVGPSERPAVLMQDNPGQTEQDRKAEPAPLPPLGKPGAEVVPWTACPDRLTERLEPEARKLTLDCATITGTNDSQNLPDHGIVSLPLLRATKGAGEKVPLVVVDDIDGKPGTVHAAELAAQLPTKVLQKVAVVGFDRRGTGGSNPIDCIPAGIRRDLLGLDPASDDVEPLLKAIRKAGQECSIALGNEQGAYDSARTAADLEEIRSQLGVPQLHAIARGDGSRVLTAYAHRYTRMLGRVVLDGVPDPSKDAVPTLAEVAASAEATLDAFADDCAAQEKCPLGGDARQAVKTLVERLRNGVEITADDVPVGPSMALYSLWAGLRSPERWPELATAVDQAQDGKPDKLAAFTTPVIEYSGDIPPTVDATLATTCNDTATRLSQDRIGELAREWREKYPVFGGLLAQRLLWCSQWPVRTDPLPDLEIPNAPPMLLISTAADPVTPEKGTTRAADQLTGAHRIAWQGAGHGAVGRSDCVDDNVARFLIDGKIPRDGVNCPA